MRLREIRRAKKMTIPQVSSISNVPIRTIENIERGNDPKVSTVIKLANALDVSLDELCRNYKESFVGFDDKNLIIYEASIEEDGSIYARSWHCKKGRYTYPKTEKRKKEFLDRAKNFKKAIIF